MPLRYMRKIIEDNSPTALSAIPVTELGEDEQAVYEAIVRHYQVHNVLPSLQTLTERGIQLPEAPEPTSFYRDEFFNSLRVRRAAELVTQVQEALQANDGREVTRILSSFRDANENPEITMTVLGDRYEDFEERLDPTSSMSGRIPTGIPAVDDAIGGTKRAGVIFIAGRPGTGKTFTAIASALNSAEDGERVLFISKEMQSEEIEDRMYVMLMDLDPGINVRRFSTSQTRQVAQRRRADLPPEILQNIVFPNHDAINTTADVEAAIRMARPTVCYIDGSYFLRALDAGKDASEREQLTALIRELRMVALRTRVTIVVTWQQNRTKTFGTEGLFGTDAASQDASLVLMLRKVKERPDLREVYIVKNRHGPDEFTVGMAYGFKPTTVGAPATLPSAPGAEGEGVQRDVRRGRNRHVERALGQMRSTAPRPPAAEIPGDQ